MKKVLICIAIFVVLLMLVYFVGTGFLVRHDVLLSDFSLSENGTRMTLFVTVSSSMGFVRDYKDVGGGVKPHMLRFYSAFGGLNGSVGAENTFELPIAEDDTEIYFSRPGRGYELMLQKSLETGEWEIPKDSLVTPSAEKVKSGQNDLLYRGEPWGFHDLVYRGETVAILKIDPVTGP